MQVTLAPSALSFEYVRTQPSFGVWDQLCLVSTIDCASGTEVRLAVAELKGGLGFSHAELFRIPRC